MYEEKIELATRVEIGCGRGCILLRVRCVKKLVHYFTALHLK